MRKCAECERETEFLNQGGICEECYKAHQVNDLKSEKAQKKMFCSKYGAQNDATNVNCKNCGAKIFIDHQITKKSHRKSKLIKAIVFSAVIISCSLIVFAKFTSSADGTDVNQVVDTKNNITIGDLNNLACKGVLAIRGSYGSYLMGGNKITSILYGITADGNCLFRFFYTKWRT
jgi:hypothetical protein